MKKAYAKFILIDEREIIAKPFEDTTADELKEHIDNGLNSEEAYVQVGIYGILNEYLERYEIIEVVA